MIDIFFYYKFEIISKENKLAEMEDDFGIMTHVMIKLSKIL